MKMRMLVMAFWVGLSASAWAVPVSDLPDISALAPYATFGRDFNYSNVTVNGNAGISNGGTLNLMAPSTINGDLFLGTGASLSSSAGTITGSIFTNQNLAAVQDLVFSASNTLKNLAANYTLGNVTTGQIFNAVDPVTVIDLNSVNLGGASQIVLNGSASDYFVVNVADNAHFGGSSGIFGSGGVDASHILINLYSNNLTGTVAMVDAVLNGSIFVPNSQATFHSTSGAIFGGLDRITLMSGATIEHVPFIPPPPPPPPVIPEPATFSLIALGLSVLGLKRCGKKRQA